MRWSCAERSLVVYEGPSADVTFERQYLTPTMPVEIRSASPAASARSTAGRRPGAAVVTVWQRRDRPTAGVRHSESCTW